MADWTKNVSNTVDVFGGGPSTKWGQGTLPYTMVWGTAKWGEGGSTNLIVFEPTKLIENSQAVTASTFSFQVDKLIENSQAVICDMYSEEKLLGIWNYVFSSDTTNAENADYPTWTSITTSPSFTCLSVGATTWT